MPFPCKFFTNYALFLFVHTDNMYNQQQQQQQWGAYQQQMWDQSQQQMPVGGQGQPDYSAQWIEYYK